MKEKIGLAASLVILGVMSFAWSHLAPGFQFDEARLGLSSYRIVHEANYWPFYSMASYAVASCQYLIALAFKLGGASITIYRGVGNLEVLLGTFFISLAFTQAGQRTAAVLFPAVIAFFPALLMNQRWSVELTTFAVLATGISVLGLVQRWKQGPHWSSYLLIAGGILLGVTSHILLFAPTFALWYCLYVTHQFEPKTKTSGNQIKKAARLDRAIASFILLVIAVFLLAAYQKEKHQHPELSAMIVLVLFLAGLTWVKFPSRFRQGALVLPSIVGSILLIPFSIYLEGHWQARQYIGFIENPLWIGSILIPLAFLLYSLYREGIKIRSLSLAAYAFLPVTLLGTYALVGRVGARYLEIPFLFVAAMIALALGCISFSKRLLFLTLWFFLGGGELWQNYFKPSIEERQVADTFRFGKIMKECSEDFVAKTSLVRKLSQEGCQLTDIHPDSRNVELQFMALGDWPKLEKPFCHLGQNLKISSWSETFSKSIN